LSWRRNFQKFSSEFSMDPMAGCELNKFTKIIKIQPESHNESKNHNPNLINDENYMFDFPTRFHA
jgi:hypothetical protein